MQQIGTTELMVVALVAVTIINILLFRQLGWTFKLPEKTKEEIEKIPIIGKSLAAVLANLAEILPEKASSTGIFLALQHPLIVQFISDFAPVALQVAQAFFQDWEGNASEFGKEFLMKMTKDTQKLTPIAQPAQPEG